MRHTFKLTKRAFFLFCVSIFLLLSLTNPARAPKGGRDSLGGRTIASVQEEDFDKKLLGYQVCYGVNFEAGSATLERRRTCKAILVHKLDAALAARGAYLAAPVRFRCENTTLGEQDKRDARGLQVVALRPNREFSAIDRVLKQTLESIEIDPKRELAARELCGFLTDCKEAFYPSHFSFRHIARCVLDGDAERRMNMLDAIGNMLFHSRSSCEKLRFVDFLKGQV